MHTRKTTSYKERGTGSDVAMCLKSAIREDCDEKKLKDKCVQESVGVLRKKVANSPYSVFIDRSK